MKAQTIPLSELEKFMKIYKTELLIKERMRRLLEISEYKLKLTAEVKKSLDYIFNFKTDYKLDPEVIAMINTTIYNEISIPRLRKALGIEEEK